VTFQPRRILLVRLSHLGDVVHALPVFHALRTAYPASEIAWAVQGEFAGLLAGLPGLARIVNFDRRGGISAWARISADLGDFHADWAIDAQGNTKSAIVVGASNAARRTGLDRADWSEAFGASVLTDCAPRARAPSGFPTHAIDRMQALACHVSNSTVSPRFDAALDALEIARGSAELDQRLGHFSRATGTVPIPSTGVRSRAADAARDGASDSPVLLHLSHPGDVRAWPARSFEALARSIANTRPVLVLSGPAEEAIGREIAQRTGGVPGIAHWTGQRGLRALAALFTAAAARDGVFVGCDSGPMHLAWASGLRVIALAGPQDSRRTGPWPVFERDGGPHRSVRATTTPECAPCFARKCSHAEGPVCMNRIDVRDVERAIERALTEARAV
jgi:heptosyltransferase I